MTCKMTTTTGIRPPKERTMLWGFLISVMLHGVFFIPGVKDAFKEWDFEIPDEIPALLRSAGHHPMGGLHAVEHAALSLFPLFALCDRHDVAGISSVRHAQTGHPAIFFYDGHPGGVGLVSHSGGVCSLTSDMLGQAGLELPPLTSVAADGAGVVRSPAREIGHGKTEDARDRESRPS